MYGSVNVSQAGEVAPPIEPISTINENTANALRDANGNLSQLLVKVRGSQPEKTADGNLSKMPERHVLGDSRNLRDLAASIYEQVTELHRYIGHDKQ